MGTENAYRGSFIERPGTRDFDGWFSSESLKAMQKAAEEFERRGIKLSVVERKDESDQVRVKITGEEPKVGLGNYWRRVEEILNELVDGKPRIKARPF